MYLCFLIFLKGGQTNFINTVLEGKVKVKKKPQIPESAKKCLHYC